MDMQQYPFFEEISLVNIILRLKSEYHILKKDLNLVFGYPKRLERLLKQERQLEAYECEALFSFIRNRVLSRSSSLAGTLRKWFPALSIYQDDMDVEEATADANTGGQINDSIQKTSTFILQCMENSSPIRAVRMAFHTGWAWVRDPEKVDILEKLLKQGISFQILANPDSVMQDISVGFRDPSLELRYTGFDKTLAEWNKYANAYHNLSVRVSLLPVLRQMILVEFCDGSARGFFRDYIYGSSRSPAIVKNEENDPLFSIYVKEFVYLWRKSQDYEEWHTSLPKMEEVMQPGMFILLYPRHAPVADGNKKEDSEWVYSKLTVGAENQVTLCVDVNPSAKADPMQGRHEYMYSGKGRLTRSNVFLALQDEHGEEPVHLSICRPLHDEGRFLGILSSLSPNGLPVSLKCALLRPEILPKINKSILHDILCRRDCDACGLMALDTQDFRLFYSNKMFL